MVYCWVLRVRESQRNGRPQASRSSSLVLNEVSVSILEVDDLVTHHEVGNLVRSLLGEEETVIPGLDEIGLRRPLFRLFRFSLMRRSV